MKFFPDEMRRDPYPMYDQMRSNSPLLYAAPIDSWMVFDYEGVKRTLTDHAAFSSAVTPVTGKSADWLVFSDPPRHTKLRAIILRAFTPRSIACLEPRIRERSRELLDEQIERGEMDLVQDYADPLPTIVISEMLGIPIEDRARILRWGEVIVNLSSAFSGGEEATRAVTEHAAAKEEMSAYLADLIAARRRAPKDDLLTRLVEAEADAERLTEREILNFFQLLLAAGTETTSNLISNAVLCFLENPTELSRLRAAPELLPSAIEEVLRYRSPLQMVFREAKRDVEMHDQTIPAGKMVLSMLGSANRDPRVFREPSRFEIRRDPNPHIAFGHGIHFCIGASLGRLEATIALSDLLSRLEGIELAGKEPWEPRKAINVHGPARLPIRFEPRRRGPAAE